ncbi:MAG: hypothetical protein KDA24_21560, partial [Deltaproteobacteria bacterium]|nr:hypothetical protein [Deltaproteobacteria bacterium]
MPLGTWPTSSIVLVAAALLAACGAIASDDEEDAQPGGCAPLPEDIFVSGPKDGHYVRDRLRVRVGGEGVPTVTSLSLERDGDEVEGSWEPAGSSGWEFLPSDALTPATTYAWAVESSAGCVDGSFTTSPAGAPVEAPAALVGRTFDVSVSTRSDWVGILLSNQWAPVFGPTPRSLFRLRVDGLEE